MGKDMLKVIQIVGGRGEDEPSTLPYTAAGFREEESAVRVVLFTGLKGKANLVFPIAERRQGNSFSELFRLFFLLNASQAAYAQPMEIRKDLIPKEDGLGMCSSAASRLFASAQQKSQTKPAGQKEEQEKKKKNDEGTSEKREQKGMVQEDSGGEDEMDGLGSRIDGVGWTTGHSLLSCNL